MLNIIVVSILIDINEQVNNNIAVSQFISLLSFVRMEDVDECKELQAEEIEALRSIYDGDPAFTVHSDTKFQYKMGAQDSDR